METYPPPTWTQWAAVLTAIIAGLGLIGQTVTYFIDRWTKKRDIHRAKLDEYWLRTVLLPTCIEPLLELAANTSRKVTQLGQPLVPLGADEIRNINGEFTSLKLEIVNRSVLITVIGDSAYESFSAGLDDLEDEYAKYLRTLGVRTEDLNDEDKIRAAPNFIQQFIWEGTRKIVEQLIELHKNA